MLTLTLTAVVLIAPHGAVTPTDCPPIEVTQRARDERAARDAALTEITRRVRSSLVTRAERIYDETTRTGPRGAQAEANERFSATTRLEANFEYAELIELSVEDTGDTWIATARLDRLRAAERHARDAAPLEDAVRRDLTRLEAALDHPARWLALCPGDLAARAAAVEAHRQTEAWLRCAPVPRLELVRRAGAALDARAARLAGLRWHLTAPPPLAEALAARWPDFGLGPHTRAGAPGRLTATLAPPATTEDDGVHWATARGRLTLAVAGTPVGEARAERRQPGSTRAEATRRATDALADALIAETARLAATLACHPPAAPEPRRVAAPTALIVTGARPPDRAVARPALTRALTTADDIVATDGPAERWLHARLERLTDDIVPGWQTTLTLADIDGRRPPSPVSVHCHGCTLLEHTRAYDALIAGATYGELIPPPPVIWGLAGHPAHVEGGTPSERTRVEDALRDGGARLPAPTPRLVIAITSRCTDAGRNRTRQLAKARCAARLTATDGATIVSDGEGHGHAGDATLAEERARDAAIRAALDTLARRLPRPEPSTTRGTR